MVISIRLSVCHFDLECRTACHPTSLIHIVNGILCCGSIAKADESSQSGKIATSLVSIQAVQIGLCDKSYAMTYNSETLLKGSSHAEAATSLGSTRGR